MKQNDTFLLFTYGTLMQGQLNNKLLENAVFVKEAITKPQHKLFRVLGNFPFPALVDDGDVAVKGEVYEVSILDLPRLDALEGHPFFYERRVIELDGIEDEVIAYFFVDADVLKKFYAEIESGDWRSV